MSARDDRGQVTAFVAVFVIAIIAIAGLVIDGGYAVAARQRAINEAEAAARAGLQQLTPESIRQGDPTPDPTRATQAATDYLAATGHEGSVQVVGDRVVVTVTIDQPMYILGFAGLGTVTVHGTGEARPAKGVTQEIP